MSAKALNGLFEPLEDSILQSVLIELSYTINTIKAKFG
jgi:hypothetical protein